MAVQDDAKNEHKKTPFSLTFSTEAMLPVPLTVGSFRTTHFEEEIDDKDLRANMDLIKEKRKRSNIRQAAYKNIVERYYNQRVKEKAFKVCDYVLRRNKESHAQPQGKLGPTWEGPYKVIEAYRNSVYTLETMEGRPILRTWNAINLRKFHF